MALVAGVIGSAWVVAVPVQCRGLGGACVPWWPVACGLWPGCWVVCWVVIGGLGGGDRWPDRWCVACPGGVPWCLIWCLICPGGGLIGGLPALMPAHQGNHIILRIIRRKPRHSDDSCQI